MRKIKKIKLGIILLVAVTLIGLSFGSVGLVFSAEPLAVAKNFDRNRAELVEDEIIVKYKGDTRPFRVVKVSQGKVREKIKEYLTRRDVEYAEPNYIAHSFIIPNDPYYSYQWHLDNSVYDGINMESAWDISQGAGVTVAVIDTGVAYENYRQNWRNRYYQAPDLADTCFVPGYDFVNNDTHPDDDNSHGTHIAGTIAQSTNNNVGVAGVAFKSCLMPVKVLNRDGSGSYANMIDGIYFAVDNGAKVINLSLGGSSDSQTLRDAVAYAYNKGVTVIAAAGNDGSAIIAYPAAYDEYVIAVGATRYDETLAYYSNFGSSLDLVAPGGDLNVDQNSDGYSDGVLQNTFNPNTKNTSDFGYWFFQGTSTAAPHVAGAAALLISKGVATNPNDVRTALESTAEDLGTAGRDDTYGWGLIDAAAALSWIPGPVDNPPTITIASPAEGTVVKGASVLISANAADDIGIDRVEFLVDNILIGSDNTVPYEIVWDSTAVLDGSHTISATAYDTASQTASASISVTVDNINEAPIANAGPDKSVFVDDTVSFDGSVSADPDGTIVSYDWNFGDENSLNGVTVSHVYAVAGVYTVTLTVADNSGATGQDTAIVTVSEKPSQPTMHVGDITFSYDKRILRTIPYCRVTVVAPILDTSETGVEGAAVLGAWSGDYDRNVSWTTNGEGTVSFRTGWIRGCGTFIFTVNDVVKESWLYDPNADIETSDSITIP